MGYNPGPVSFAALAATLLVLSPVAFAQNAKRPIVFSDLPSALGKWLENQNLDQTSFDKRVAEINARTAARERDGEFDHLIFFILQSVSFTNLPRIEPAASAYQFTNRLTAEERERFLNSDDSKGRFREKLPLEALARIQAFLNTLDNRTPRERLVYFRDLLRGSKTGLVETLSDEYVRVMRFLYRKEFGSRAIAQSELAGYISALYQTRGHSTDTQIEANFAVYTALATLKADQPQLRIERVLLIGPGLDFAPRTDLIDAFPPQSYQPFALADALLGLGLADPERLRLHCVDINDRVLNYLEGIRDSRKAPLSIISGIRELPERPLTQDFKDYFENLGKSIGVISGLAAPPIFRSHLKKSLLVRPEIAGRITADRLNIVTQRYESPELFDLVVVTNVFPYFNQVELLLALCNISGMLKSAGRLIHNDLNTVPAQFVQALDLPLSQARTMVIAASKTAPLFDGVAIHQKK